MVRATSPSRASVLATSRFPSKLNSTSDPAVTSAWSNAGSFGPRGSRRLGGHRGGSGCEPIDRAPESGLPIDGWRVAEQLAGPRYIGEALRDVARARVRVDRLEVGAQQLVQRLHQLVERVALAHGHVDRETDGRARL